MTNSKIYFKLQDDCHPGKPRKERRVSQDNRQKNSPRVDSAPHLSFRPLVALPLAVDVISFPFSKLKVLELLLGFVVLFTLALLSTTCMNKKLRFTTSKLRSGNDSGLENYRTGKKTKVLLKLTCFQFFELPGGSFFQRFTRRTQALQISPCLFSFNWKQPLNSTSYFDEDVNRELEDLAPQMQQPRRDRKTRGRCEANITGRNVMESSEGKIFDKTALQCAKQLLPALSSSCTWWERTWRIIAFCLARGPTSMLRSGHLSARCSVQANTWQQFKTVNHGEEQYITHLLCCLSKSTVSRENPSKKYNLRIVSLL